MALRLTGAAKAEIRAALVALGPERRAGLEGRCFSKGSGQGEGPYRNRDGRCALGALVPEAGPMPGVRDVANFAGIARHGTGNYGYTTEFLGLVGIMHLNDDGQLRTRAA